MSKSPEANVSTSPKSTRQQRREDRLEAIKVAAIEVFSEKGYHQAKVSEIVERVGIAQGTFYLYFEGKQQLFQALLHDFLTLVVQTVAAWEPESLESLEDLQRELSRVGMMLTHVFSDNGDLTAIFFKEAIAVAAGFDEAISEFYDTLASMLASFNQILCDRGLIQPMNFRLLAYATIGQVERIIHEYLVGDSLQDISERELVEHLVMFFLTGTQHSIPTGSSSPDKALP